jgi:isopenicillin N synthase-like dioxygenase
LRCEEEGEAAIMVAVTEVADVRKNYGSVMQLAGGHTVPDVFKINAKIEECRTVAAGGRAIPVVDLSGLHGEKRAELVEQMRAASEEWGFFQIVNHSVPGEYMDEILKVHTEFFEMPMEEKMKYYSDDVRAPFKYGVGQVATSYQEQAWKDHLTLLYQEKMDTSNWPKVPAKFIEITEAYNHAVNKLKSELMQALSEGLGLQSNELDDVFGPVQRTYTNFYPKCPEADRVFGARPHSDPNSITILLQDDVGGLEVRDLKYREWVQVKTIPHAFVINMGDQMEVFTNGKYRSISHRVRVNPDKNRISIASFISPKPRTVVEPSPLLVGEEGPLYKGDNFRDYLLGFYGNDINEKLYIESIKLKQGGQLQLK